MTQRDYVTRERNVAKGKSTAAGKKKSTARKPGAKKRATQTQQASGSSVNAIRIRAALVFVALLGFAYFLWAIKDNAPPPDNIAIEPKEIVDEDGLPQLPEEEWEYIKSLPGYEVEVDVTAKAPSTKRYLMQCASFRTRAQAEEMKANIAFQGMEAQIRRSQGNAGDWFRVILGPYESKRDAERARHTLRRVNINTCKIWFWNL